MNIMDTGRETFRILDADGEVVDDTNMPDVSDELLKKMLQEMKFGRAFDEKAVQLQRRGELGTYPPMAGQEGSQVGSALALRDEDWVIPSYREHLVERIQGINPARLLLYWRGDERGHEGWIDEQCFPTAVPIATQIPHAAGMAWADVLDDNVDSAYVCYFGDGATSEGDFHEGLNFAGVFNAPCVFFCNNNQYAISVPREQQTASDTLAQKADGYGFTGVRVDGMDPLAVYAATDAAIEHATSDSDERPVLIEAVQYRYGAHTTADDPTKYRDDEEVEEWKQKDPITRLEKYMRNQGIVDDEDIADMDANIDEEIDEIVEYFRSFGPPDVDQMFDSAYATLPDEVAKQHSDYSEP